MHSMISFWFKNHFSSMFSCCSLSWFKISTVLIIFSSSLCSCMLTASRRHQFLSLISLCFSLLSSWFSLLLLLWWRSLLQISHNDFALMMICWRWTQDDFQMMLLTSRSLSLLSCQRVFSSLQTLFQVCSLSFSVSSADSSCADWQLTQQHVDASAFLSSLSNFSFSLRASARCFYIRWAHKVLAAYSISHVYSSLWLNSSAR